MALKSIGLSKRHVVQTCQLVAAILHLGNIEFTLDCGRDVDAAVVRNVDVLNIIAEFLGIQPSALKTSLAAHHPPCCYDPCLPSLTTLVAQYTHSVFSSLYLRARRFTRTIDLSAFDFKQISPPSRRYSRALYLIHVQHNSDLTRIFANKSKTFPYVDTAHFEQARSLSRP
jgi:hypothetical protein